jgi:protein-S-isoprenylcysteine O-methyltransferase Ste14
MHHKFATVHPSTNIAATAPQLTSEPPPTDSPKRRERVNLRLLIPKLLFLPIIAFTVLTKSPYSDGGFWDTTLEVVSFLLLTIGAVGRVWVSAYISGRKTSELVTDGPYSMVRNPLYFFTFVAYIGAGLAFERITVAVTFAAMFFATHWPTILAEENKLRSKFGEEFESYATRVPRFVPRFKHISMPDLVTFRARIFNRATLDSWLILLIYILAHLIEYGQNNGLVPAPFGSVP